MIASAKTSTSANVPCPDTQARGTLRGRTSEPRQRPPVDSEQELQGHVAMGVWTKDELRCLRELLHRRIREACGNRVIAEIAQLTRTNHETTRRYMRGITAPSPEFMDSLCALSGVSAEWLLRGRGPRLASEVAAKAAQALSTEALMAELAERVPAGKRNRVGGRRVATRSGT